jgi:serine/threonine-protein kinase
VRTIGQRYELRAEIASGGMATVHLARQVGAAGFARIVAVKRLHERYARDPDFVAMFLDEARLVARIRHPNVVQTIDVVAETPSGGPLTAGGGELFIVMEYVHGESLLRLLSTVTRNGGVVPPKIAAAILAASLHGLHDAHEARGETGEPLGIVHRDVSPHNILVGVDGIARVLDFGVAKASERITTTHEGQLKGKLSYMAPEQVSAGPVDRRTDVYAAAVVLWELLAGTKLFHGPSEGAVIQAILSAPVPPPGIGNAEIPPGLEAVVARGLARDPDERFATAQDMAIALEQAIPLATVTEVGAFLREACHGSLEVKAQIISKIEAKASSRNLRDAVDSLRTISRGAPSGSPSGETPVSPGIAGPHVQSNAPFASSPPFASDPPFASNPPFANEPPSGSPPFFSSPPIAGIRSFPPGQDPEPTATKAMAHSNNTRIALAVVVAVATFAVAIGGALLVHAGRARTASGPASGTVTSSGTVMIASDSGNPLMAAAVSAKTNASCPAGMVMVPGGRFFMGSDDDLPAEKPAHNVTLRAFCMDKREATAEAYRACSDRGDCKRAGQTNRWDGITAREQKTYDPLCNVQADSRGAHPINCVDWAMADRFCKAEGKRLPTEAEWEFAARGSDGRKFPWGDALPTSKHLNACGTECVAWLKKRGAQPDGFLYPDDDGWATTAPVGSFPAGASRWGIEDMVGNVWEWVSDFYGAYTPDDQSDPGGPQAGKSRVIRGGAWNGAYADWVRPTFRYQSPPDTRSHGIGFRCAK